MRRRTCCVTKYTPRCMRAPSTSGARRARARNKPADDSHRTNLLTMFTTLLKPARGLMGRLKYLEKFLLISVLFVLPLASVMYAYITDAAAQIDFANSELSGTRYLRPLNAVFADVLRPHAAAERGAPADLAAAQKALTTDLAAVAKVEAELGSSLKTADQFYALKNDV